MKMCTAVIGAVLLGVLLLSLWAQEAPPPDWDVSTINDGLNNQTIRVWRVHEFPNPRDGVAISVVGRHDGHSPCTVTLGDVDDVLYSYNNKTLLWFRRLDQPKPQANDEGYVTFHNVFWPSKKAMKLFWGNKPDQRSVVYLTLPLWPERQVQTRFDLPPIPTECRH